MQGYYLQPPEPVLFVVSKRRKSDAAVITVATTTLQSPTSLRPCFLLLVISYHATVYSTNQTAPSVHVVHWLMVTSSSSLSAPLLHNPLDSLPSCVPFPPFPPVSTSSFNQPSISSRSHGSISGQDLQISLAFLDVSGHDILSGVSYVTVFANCFTQL